MHGLGKLHHYCFVTEVNIITDHKPLVAMVSKATATLSQWLQCIMLHINQYSVCILYMPGPDLYILDWLSHHNHTKNRDQEIAGMSFSIHTLSKAIDVPVCTLIEDIRTATIEDAELPMLQTHIIRRWPQNKDDLEPSLGGYQPIRHDLTTIDGVAMKGK